MQRMHESTWFIRERLQQENMIVWFKRMMDGKKWKKCLRIYLKIKMQSKVIFAPFGF